jgi:hypothetical protein
MELALAGKEDGGNYSLAASRKMLEQYQNGWVDLKWATELRVGSPRGLWELQGNIFARHTSAASTIHFKQLPSESRNIKERDWVVNIRVAQVDDFNMDPTQDLLVIVESPVS